MPFRGVAGRSPYVTTTISTPAPVRYPTAQPGQKLHQPKGLPAGQRACVGRGGCGLVKDILDFYEDPRGKVATVCRDCERVKRTAEYVTSGRRAASIKWKYGITDAENQAILDAQGGRCAVCDQLDADCEPPKIAGRPSRVPTNLIIEHDHKLAGRAAVRGRTCQPCNWMIGYVEALPRDRWARMAGPALLAYLDNPPARAVLGTAA